MWPSSPALWVLAYGLCGVAFGYYLSLDGTPPGVVELAKKNRTVRVSVVINQIGMAVVWPLGLFFLLYLRAFPNVEELGELGRKQHPDDWLADLEGELYIPDVKSGAEMRAELRSFDEEMAASRDCGRCGAGIGEAFNNAGEIRKSYASWEPDRHKSPRYVLCDGCVEVIIEEHAIAGELCPCPSCRRARVLPPQEDDDHDAEIPAVAL